MKKKIKEALEQEYKQRLGLSGEVFERVAASVETFITEESAIEGFVKSEATKSLLTSYQSEADKARTKANAKIAELEAKLKGNETSVEEGHREEPQSTQTEDLAKIVAEAVAAAIKPISDELSGFKAEQGIKKVLSGAEEAFKGNAYVQHYADEAGEAWERALEMYQYNREWTEQQLCERAMGYFTKAVSKKGVDTSKPFKNDSQEESVPDFKNELEILKSEGIELPE